MRALLLSLALVGCTDAEPPPCAAVGCLTAPSGDPVTWTPCHDAVCYCPVENSSTPAECAL